jgi:hypothetical protein
MAETMIPVSEITFDRLQELAQWNGVSAGDALNQAVQELYDRHFWVAVNAGYAALRRDPAAWAEIEAERKLLDGTLMDGLDPAERWTEDGNVLPPSEQDQAS